MYKGDDDYFLLAKTCCLGRPAGGGIISGGFQMVSGTANLPLNAWTHVATTYDGAAQRLYVNGTQVASRAQTGTLRSSATPLTIGSDPVYGQYFAGRIDEVRVYNTALSAAQVVSDMNTPIGGGGPPPTDTEPPTAPSALTATGARASQINLAWTASTDNVGVTGYRIERCQGASCTNFTEVGSATGTSFGDGGLSASTSYRYRVRATDAAGNLSGYSNIATGTTNGPNGAPSATMVTPVAETSWEVGETISFSGSATDPEEGNLPASRLSWSLVLQHCPSTCHSHPVQTFNGVASGSFVAPDHDYPSYLELTLTATDSGGLTDSETRRLDPRTVLLTFQSSPTGLQLTVGSGSAAAPFTRTVIEGSTNSISAPSPQTLGATSYQFVSWSDGGPATHNITAAATATYTATYQVAPGGPSPLVAAYSFNEGSGTSVSDASVRGTQGRSGRPPGRRRASTETRSPSTARTRR